MSTLSLLKTSFRDSVAEGIYKEISTRTALYYYFLGKTLSWDNELSPELPVDSVNYENAVRNEIITAKQIKPTDVGFVVPRYDWTSGEVYDQYDDRYGTEVIGVNLTNGGTGYVAIPTVYIGSEGSKTWSENTSYLVGDLVSYENRHYAVTGAGASSTTAPTHTSGVEVNGTASLTYVSIDDANGSGARAVATILDNKVIDISVTKTGVGYTYSPSITIIGGGGSGVVAAAVVNKTSGTNLQRLEDSKYYVVTDDYNVYKCVDNNVGSISTVKPTGTTVNPIKTSDGYIWKFMFTIPVALRNKFLTNTYIPVTTALQTQYYSNGSISSVRVDANGTDYTSASISVSGDGYLEDNPVYITGYTISDGGSGYVSPTLNIAAPFSNVSGWQPDTQVIVGQKLSYDNNIYEVAVSGASGEIGPIHTYGTVTNGTSALKYIGTTATGTLTTAGGVITEILLSGSIRQVDVTFGGTGYITAPEVTFVNGGGSGAAASAIIQNGAVSEIIVTSTGKDYESAPSIVIGSQWTSNTAVEIGDQIFYSNRLYTVSGAGNTSSTAPTHTTSSVLATSLIAGYTYTIVSVGTTDFTAVGAATNASGVTFVATNSATGSGTCTTTEASNGTAILSYAGLPATATSSIKYGAGYSSSPIATVVDSLGNGAVINFSSAKSNARLTPIIQNQQIVGANIVDGGIGYSYADLNISGTGTGAQLSSDLSPGNINTLQANNEILTVDGTINCIPVVSQGFGYSGATITIEGDGTGATATATIINGSITKINVTSVGSGYRWARINITGNGYGASARAIISPYGGHGKNALSELHARTLMFYSNVSYDKNQGFDVNNDYRQVGIMKHPRRFGETTLLTTPVASACWVISGTISTTNFPADSLIYDSIGNRYRIVTNNGSAILAQSLDNAVPVVGTGLHNSDDAIFTVGAVTSPTIDKYSGQLLFIDNKQAFTPTAEQTVSLRTVIKF